MLNAGRLHAWRMNICFQDTHIICKAYLDMLIDIMKYVDASVAQCWNSFWFPNFNPAASPGNLKRTWLGTLRSGSGASKEPMRQDAWRHWRMGFLWIPKRHEPSGCNRNGLKSTQIIKIYQDIGQTFGEFPTFRVILHVNCACWCPFCSSTRIHRSTWKVSMFLSVALACSWKCDSCNLFHFLLYLPESLQVAAWQPRCCRFGWRQLPSTPSTKSAGWIPALQQESYVALEVSMGPTSPRE